MLDPANYFETKYTKTLVQEMNGQIPGECRMSESIRTEMLKILGALVDLFPNVLPAKALATFLSAFRVQFEPTL